MYVLFFVQNRRHCGIIEVEGHFYFKYKQGGQHG